MSGDNKNTTTQLNNKQKLHWQKLAKTSFVEMILEYVSAEIISERNTTQKKKGNFI